ncbi:hypothetical protein MY04_0738 [Flammeovirga sp. MY04]|uniref:YncE family protein n=1 Tax=Flammeovirga sp. MY04 TaxID=1191459 RepID=UPI000806121A|nr:hypothetical protein [Flammeovirga sp. MY04]ANQ48120.1 hypothetical protein MY04_0738 [Flammeovirga sp. MY04]
MKQFYKFSILFALVAFVFTSCVDDKDATPYVPGQSGFMLSNAGAFGQPNTSSITGVSISDQDTTVSQAAFESANNQKVLGLIEGFSSNGEVTVMNVAASDRIIIVNAKTMKMIYEVKEGVQNPRYTAFDGNTAYVSMWGEQQPDYSYINPKILAINLSTGAIEKSIDCGPSPEGILAHNGKLYVASSGSYNVEVYDIADLDAEPTLVDVQAVPQHFVLDNSDNVWVSGTASWSLPAEDANKGLIKLKADLSGKETVINYTGIGSDGFVTSGADKSKAYVIGSDGGWPVAKTEITEVNFSAKSTTAIITGDNFTGVGQNPATKDIYVAITPDYANPGSYSIYSETGTAKYENQEAGVGPFHFIFN